MRVKRSLLSRLEDLEKKHAKPTEIFFWRDASEPVFDKNDLCDYWKDKICTHCQENNIDRASAEVFCFQWVE